MCGIFAYVGRDPNRMLVTDIVNGAARRGPHGHGWAVSTARGISITRRLGPLEPSADDIARDTAALSGPSGTSGILLGHARMATVGAWDNQDNLQPVIAGDITVAHNGVISNPDDLYPNAPTDSIALTRAYRILRNQMHTPVQALEKLLATAQQHAWVIVIADDGALYAHRQHHPLWQLDSPDGTYLSSHRFHFDAQPVPENKIVKWGGQ